MIFVDRLCNRARNGSISTWIIMVISNGNVRFKLIHKVQFPPLLKGYRHGDNFLSTEIHWRKIRIRHYYGRLSRS